MLASSIVISFKGFETHHILAFLFMASPLEKKKKKK